MLQQRTSKIAFFWNGSLGVSYEAGSFRGEKGPSISTMASRSFHAQKNRAEMYIRDLIEKDEPSDLSSRTDTLAI